MANNTKTLKNCCNGCKQGLGHGDQVVIVKNLKFFHLSCYKRKNCFFKLFNSIKAVLIWYDSKIVMKEVNAIANDLIAKLRSKEKLAESDIINAETQVTEEPEFTSEMDLELDNLPDEIKNMNFDNIHIETLAQKLAESDIIKSKATATEEPEFIDEIDMKLDNFPDDNKNMTFDKIPGETQAQKLKENDMINAQTQVTEELEFDSKIDMELKNLPENIKNQTFDCDNIPAEDVGMDGSGDGDSLIVNLTSDELWPPRKFVWSKKPFV